MEDEMEERILQETKPIEELLDRAVNEELIQIIISNARNKEKITKVKVRPVLLKGKLLFQETAYIGTQVFHENYEKETLIQRVVSYLSGDFRQCEVESENGKAAVLVSKKGKITITEKKYKGNGKSSNGSNDKKKADLSHNRIKTYILEEGKPVPFLIDLGVQTKDGRIVKSRYDKFKQINRFLEFIEDILPTLSKERKLNIIDFGCGKSYLTFAMYYYLKELQGYDVRITGLDLKTEVIRHCNELAVKYGYEELRFLQGDISSYEGENKADMVVTLHACDTATDYALAKAVQWDAEVILSVPCCQHELNKQIKCEQLRPVLKYGLIKERISALFTDAIRANLLENHGYEVQILEFIDMEHTPKNILIRAVKRKVSMKKKESPVEELTDFLHVDPTLRNLLKK